MADLQRRRGATAASPSRLLDHAVGLALDHAAAAPGARWRFGPLVLVSPAMAAASAAVTAAVEARGGATIDRAVCSGLDLDREIAAALAGDRLDRITAALAARPLVIVDGIDDVAGERQQVLVHVLDAAAAAGGAWIVSTRVHPATGFVPRCASRLCAGLVVPLPTGRAAAPLPAGAAPSVGRIIRAAARLHDVPAAAVVGPSRGRTVTAARSLAMYLARRLTARSYHAIGAACGGRDHTTVLHGVRVCTARLARDQALAADVERVVEELGAAGSPTPPNRRRGNVGSAMLARAIRGRRGRRRRPA